MAFSDARNERERAEGDRSGRSSGGGGEKARAAEKRNKEAMSNSSRGKGKTSNPAAKAIPGFRNVVLSNAGLPQRPGYGPTVNRGNNRPSGPFQSPSYSKLTPNDQLPSTGVAPGIADLIGGIIDGDVYGKYGEPDLAPKDITPRDVTGDGSGIGNTGGRDSAAQFFDTRTRPPAPDAVTPNPSVVKTLDDYLNEIQQGFINPNARYYLEQRGLVDPTAPAGIPAEWQPTIDREFNFIKSTLPQDLYDPKAKEADIFNKLRTYFTDQFGDTALSNEQNRRRSQYTGALQGKGFEGQIDQSFGDTADDDLINSILQPQYQSAQDIIGNQQKRGTLTPSGYQYALNRLNDQRTAGLNKLQGIGAGEREKLGGGVRDYLAEIYGKAGEYTLGQQFDPNSFDTEFGNRLTSASGSLEGNIRAAAPTNLFDTASVQQDAGNVQGQTSRGGLLDTLASRRRGSSRGRGLGTTGAF